MFCSSDFCFEPVEAGEEESSEEAVSGRCQHGIFREHFRHDDSLSGKDFDPFVELLVPEEEALMEREAELTTGDVVESALAASHNLLVDDTETELENPAHLKSSVATDLKELVDQCCVHDGSQAGMQTVEAPADFTPESKKETNDFVKLIHGSADSGIGHAAQLLESPFVPPPPSSPALDSALYLKRQLSNLTPITLSPEEELYVSEEGVFGYSRIYVDHFQYSLLLVRMLAFLQVHPESCLGQEASAGELGA